MAKSKRLFWYRRMVKNAGIINILYNLEEVELPFSGYEMSDYFRI